VSTSPTRDTIEIVEVGPRDGLQNEDTILTTRQKIDLIDHLVRAGVRRIEAVSFAHPTYVPQMADAEAVMEGIEPADGVSYIGLVMNARGLERALATRVDEINMPIMATDTFNRENQGVATAESIAVLRDAVAAAHARDVSVSATIGGAWGCPFEGEVPIAGLLRVVETVAAAGVDELAVADTIGVADPWAVTERIDAVSAMTGDLPLRVHFHDTRNTGIANTYAAIQSGVRVVDASVGGIGGCPFAPAATGNIPTDDLVYMLDRAGFSHGLSLQGLIGVSGEVADALGRDVPAMLPRAGGFP
jgi:hydroxymethylglutaryl-CoA lyase